MNKKSLGGPRALAIIGSIVMLISLVLPYATSSDDTMTAFTIAERWKELQAIANMSLGVSEVILVMLIAIAIFAVLVFSLLATLAYVYFNLSFTPYGAYSIGFGVYLFYIAAIAAIAGSIWMIAVKRHNKGAAVSA